MRVCVRERAGDLAHGSIEILGLGHRTQSVRVCACERDGVCVIERERLCVREREREREIKRERDRESVCV